MAPTPPRSVGWRATGSSPWADDVGAKMLAAVAAQEWLLAGGASEGCVALARGALAGGELIAADNGLLGVTAIVVLALADRDEAVAAWERSLADAHRHGSLLSRKSVTLWRGFTLYWRGELVEAEASLRSSAEGRLWGAGAQGWLYFDAILSAVLRERGELAVARQVLEGSTDPGDRGDSTRFWLHSKLELLVAEGRFDEALAVSEQFAGRFSHIDSPIDTPWRSPTAVALHRVGRVPEARRRRRARSRASAALGRAGDCRASVADPGNRGAWTDWSTCAKLSISSPELRRDSNRPSR